MNAFAVSRGDQRKKNQRKKREDRRFFVAEVNFRYFPNFPAM